MNSREAYWVGAGLVTTAALLLTDRGTYNSMKEAQYDGTWVSRASPVITEFGSTYGLGVLGAFAGYGFIAGDPRAKETAYLATEAFLTSGIWGVTIKLLTSRERPSVASESGGEWNGPFGFFRKNRGQSISAFDAFPSGHTLTAFSIATVVASQYSDNIIVPIVCYTASSLVGISRLTEDAHWASDVFVGALLGYLTAREVIANNPSVDSRREFEAGHARVHWTLGIRDRSPVLCLSMQF